ncbi:MAG: DegV family EDD domain-containing protein [Eubacterium sp.]|nr:DegV family EDD domain-containing protein [Eubacterium sp.]
MKKIIITTETGSDMPAKMVEQYGVKVVPMHVNLGDESFLDGSIPVDKVFEYFETTGKAPKTSATNINEYIDFFAKINEENPDCVIYNFAYTANASSTYQNAVIAAREFDNVYIVDTKEVSAGSTAHIILGYNHIQKRIAEQMEDYDKLFEELQILADKVVCEFIPDKLDYLKAGGRVSNAQYLGATILHLKPLIEINPEGKLVTSKKYRGNMSKVVKEFMKDFFSKYDLDQECLYLMYGKGVAPEVLRYMEDTARAAEFKSWEYVMTGCVVSSHGGKGAIGLTGILK